MYFKKIYTSSYTKLRIFTNSGIRQTFTLIGGNALDYPFMLLVGVDSGWSRLRITEITQVLTGVSATIYEKYYIDITLTSPLYSEVCVFGYNNFAISVF